MTMSGFSRLVTLGLLGAALLPVAAHAGARTYEMKFSSPEGDHYSGTGTFVLATPPAASGVQVFSNDRHPGDGVLQSLSVDVGGIAAAAQGTVTVSFDGPAVTGIRFSSDSPSGRRLAASGADLTYEVYNALNEELAAGTIQVTAVAAPPATSLMSSAMPPAPTTQAANK